MDHDDLINLYINGNEEPGIVPSGTAVEVAVEITGSVSGEFWISGSTPYGTYWLNPSMNWIKSTAPISAGQYSLSGLPVTSILNSPLPEGLYTFVVILDENPNGILDDMSNIDGEALYVSP